MDTDEVKARANLGDMVVEAVNEGRQVSVILDGIPERIVVTDALHEGGIIDIEDAGGIEYRTLLSAVKVVILGPPTQEPRPAQGPRPTLRSVPKPDGGR